MRAETAPLSPNLIASSSLLLALGLASANKVSISIGGMYSFVVGSPACHAGVRIVAAMAGTAYHTFFKGRCSAKRFYMLFAGKATFKIPLALLIFRLLATAIFFLATGPRTWWRLWSDSALFIVFKVIYLLESGKSW